MSGYFQCFFSLFSLIYGLNPGEINKVLSSDDTRVGTVMLRPSLTIIATPKGKDPLVDLIINMKRGMYG